MQARAIEKWISEGLCVSDEFPVKSITQRCGCVLGITDVHALL
jgi:hypothetical protein